MTSSIRKMSKEVGKYMEEQSLEIPDSGGARKSLLVTTGDTLQFPFKDATTMWEMMHRGLKLSGDGRCISWIDESSECNWMTYSEVIDRAQSFGSGLVNIGMKPGQSTIVGIYAQICPEWSVSEFGCCSQSVIIVPLFDVLGPDACTFMINHAEIEIIICDKERKVRNILTKNVPMPSLKQIIVNEEIGLELKQLAKDKGIEIHFFKDIEDIGSRKPVPTLLPKPSDVFIVCYTSGTTGDPKGVIITHENIITAGSSAVLVEGDAITEVDTSISYLPMAHSFEHLVQIGLFLNGGSIAMFRGDITLLTEDMRILKPTIFPAVPRVLNKIYHKAQAVLHPKTNSNKYSNNEDKCSEANIKENDVQNPALYKAIHHSLGGRVHLIITGAAPIPENVIDFYQVGLGCQVTEVYGQTECSGPCTLSVSKDDASIGSVGPPLPCCMVKLVDVPENGYFSAEGQGEVCVKGYNVFKGYLKDPVRTSEALDEDGWLHTGDIGAWLPNGTLKIVDRKKNIFKLSQGEYVAPEKISNIYSDSPYISQILVEGDSLHSYLVAVVIPEKEAIISWSKENLKVETWDEICRNPAVKQLILDDMNRLGKSAQLLRFEQVKDIYLHSEPLTLESGQLTPTLKMKRAICRKLFKDQIAAMYKKNEII